MRCFEWHAARFRVKSNGRDLLLLCLSSVFPKNIQYSQVGFVETKEWVLSIKWHCSEVVFLSCQLPQV